ncbi:MAG: hypothetical protein ACP5RD_05760 [bacterium]
MKTRKLDTQLIKNYFYNLKIQDKNNKDTYIQIKYGYTNNNIIKDNTVIYFKDLNIVSNKQNIKIKEGYYKKNIIYVNSPIKIEQNYTVILIKKDIYINVDKLILVGKDVYIITNNSRSLANQIVINLKTLDYNLTEVSGTFYKQ